MRSLLAATVLVLAVAAIGTSIAIQQGLPAEFGGRGDPDNVAGEFITRGTAMSPPLTTLLVLVGAVALCLRRDLLAKLGLVGIIVLGVLFTIGGLAEPNDPQGSSVPAALHGVLKFLGVAASITMALLALRELVGRFVRTPL